MQRIPTAKKHLLFRGVLLCFDGCGETIHVELSGCAGSFGIAAGCISLNAFETMGGWKTEEKSGVKK